MLATRLEWQLREMEPTDALETAKLLVRVLRLKYIFRSIMKNIQKSVLLHIVSLISSLLILKLYCCVNVQVRCMQSTPTAADAAAIKLELSHLADPPNL